MRVSPAPPPAAGPQNPPLSHAPHMTPAVGGPGNVVMPPHPGSGQSENRNSSMHAPGYPPGAPPHMPTGPPGPHGYPSKMSHMPPGPPGPPGAPYGQPGYQQGPGGHQYPAARPQGHMMQPYPQNYPPPPGGPQAPPQGPQGHQYPPRPPHNSHVPPSQPYGYSHFSQQGWGQGMGPMMGGNIPGKGGPSQMPGQPSPAPPPPGTNSVSGPRPHFLKQHMQHKMVVYPPSSTGSQMYPNGPGMPPGMVNSRESPQNNMPPPTSTPQPLTPSGAPNMETEHPPQQGVPPSSAPPSSMTMNSSNSASSNSVGNAAVNSVNNNPPQIGPDGQPLVDEASQQSTVSNTSGASGDDRSCTPKPHKESMMAGLAVPRGPGDVMMGGPGSQHPPSHTPTPVNSAPSPGTASMTSQPDDFESVNSPGWPRSPSGTPVYANSQPPPPSEIYRTTKPGDSIMRLYEMSDSPERRAWLDKLLRFMEENKTPITACPTISKNPLDLYALYLHVRERGGFEEVTKNKQWKDVAAVMGIGASSSGSYTLRRHYMKHILAFECKFDRGGIDPQPIINQIESSQKKKTKTISVPSPGSNSSSMDGFSNGPHMPGGPGMPGPYSQYPPSSEFPGHMQQRPPNQSTPDCAKADDIVNVINPFEDSLTPRAKGAMGKEGWDDMNQIHGYQGFQGNQYPGYQGMHGGYAQAGFPNSGFPPESRGYQSPHPNHQGNYQGYQQPGYQRPGFPPPPPPPQPGYQQEQYPMATSGPATTYGGSQLAKQLLTPPPRNTGPVVQGFQYTPKPGASSPGPQPPSTAATFQGPRRHPDFDKGQPGWRPPSSQYAGYGPQGPPQPPAQQPWSRPNDSGPQGASQWNQQRYPTPPSQSFQSQPRWPSSGFASSVGGPRAAGPPTSGTKNYLVPPATSFRSGGYGTYMGKQLFPMDSVEAVSPVLFKRKRMTRADLSPIDPWRLLMSLRCGLASEVTWALDVLNILLFDDQTVVYFGLNHMPGLLETLIEHLRRGLINMFNICSELELGRDDEATGANKRIKAEQNDDKDRPWFARPPPSPSLELDLGRLTEEEADPSDKETFLKGMDYTLTSRTGKPVRLVKREGRIFMREGSREWDKWEGFDSGVDTWSVGGGECTAHIICSMQSAVPPLPFTRLIPTKEQTPPTKGEPPAPPPKKQTRSEQSECRRACVTSQCVIKIEKLDVGAAEKERLSSDKVKAEARPKEKGPPPVKTEPKDTPAKGKEAKDKGVLGVLSDKCNGPKETSTKPIFSSKFNTGRKNNAKTSKLDAIVKRIKKEPMDSSLGLFTKSERDIPQTDSKSLLDHYLKKDESADSEKQQQQQPPPPPQNKAPPKAPSEAPVVTQPLPPPPSTPTPATAQVPIPASTPAPATNPTPTASSRGPNGKDTLLAPVEVKVPVKSPVRLPSLPVSPLKISTTRTDGSGLSREGAGFKRPYDHLEEESWGPDEASLTTTTEGQDWLARRVVAVGTVVRNLSFIPGNEDVMSKSASLLALLGKTILLHHSHPARAPATAHYDRDEESDFSDWCSSLACDTFWWWPYLHHVHENTLVTLANMAGHLDLSYYPEEISRPILNGLLHWATCPASYGQDTLPGGGGSSQSALSPQRLALEALVKLCVLDPNTDLVLATPPFARLDMLCGHLTRLLCRGEDQVAREFAINLFHYFSAADSGVARVIAMQGGCVSLLLAFIEEAESAALSVANLQGVSALKENPELMGTSLDMVRRSANTLVNLSRVPDNARVIAACESRFLALVMSQILDTYVASQLAQVLYNVAQVQSEVAALPSPPLSPIALEDPPADEKDSQEDKEQDQQQPPAPSEGAKSAEGSGSSSSTAAPPPSGEDSNGAEENKHPPKVVPSPSPPVSSSTPTSAASSTTNALPTSSASTVSTPSSSSSSSSPVSMTSHPPLSPSSLAHATPYADASIGAPKAAAAPQATPTL